MWYVDDNKVSHKDSKVVDDVLEMMKRHFGNITIDRGKQNTFLGMNIKLRDDKKIEIEIIEQLQECLDLYNEYAQLKITEKSSSPAQKYLRTIDENSPDLSGIQKELFHSLVYKLLWIMMRARPDLQTAISFLCTRVTKSTEQD